MIIISSGTNKYRIKSQYFVYATFFRSPGSLSWDLFFLMFVCVCERELVLVYVGISNINLAE